jgi:hypothetical protein
MDFWTVEFWTLKVWFSGPINLGFSDVDRLDFQAIFEWYINPYHRPSQTLGDYSSLTL